MERKNSSLYGRISRCYRTWDSDSGTVSGRLYLENVPVVPNPFTYERRISDYKRCRRRDEKVCT